MTSGASGVRIIGGTLRGRRIPLGAHAALRPTPDRVRETLFNWLAPVVRESRCLDLFAGSGALGLEAWSRGAAAVTFVERNQENAAALTALLARLDVKAPVYAMDALAFLENQPACGFDIAFLDPPFDAGLLAPALKRLREREIVRRGGFLYIETRRDHPCILPKGLRWHRQGRAGQVAFGLAVDEE